MGFKEERLVDLYLIHHGTLSGGLRYMILCVQIETYEESSKTCE